MAFPSALSPSASGLDLTPLRAKWGWIVALGVVYTIAGFIALGSIVTATVVSVFVVGIMMIVAGIFEVINSFQIKSWGEIPVLAADRHSLHHWRVRDV